MLPRASNHQYLCFLRDFNGEKVLSSETKQWVVPFCHCFVLYCCWHLSLSIFRDAVICFGMFLFLFVFFSSISLFVFFTLISLLVFFSSISLFVFFTLISLFVFFSSISLFFPLSSLFLCNFKEYPVFSFRDAWYTIPPFGRWLTLCPSHLAHLGCAVAPLFGARGCLLVFSLSLKELSGHLYAGRVFVFLWQPCTAKG